MDLSHCTHSEYDDDGFLGIQADAYGEGGEPPGHQLSPGGLDHRPVDPQGEIAEMCWVYPDGHQNFVFPLNDPRTESALPNLNKGATRIFDTGTYKGHPFHFTATLDPIAEHLVLESHRAGGKVQTKNQEGALLELAAQRYAISGVTSVELGGQEQLAKFSSLSNALTQMQAAIAAIAGGTVQPAVMATPVGNSASAVAAFASSGATLITKGA